LWTLTAYIQTQSESYDMGAAVLNANAYGQQAVNLLGGQGSPGTGRPTCLSTTRLFGYVNGVTAFSYTSIPGYSFSPYFGTDAYDLYLAA
jgi:hypothetical protein